MRLDELIERLQEMLAQTQAVPEYAVQVEVNTDLGRTKVDLDHVEYDGAGGVILVT